MNILPMGPYGEIIVRLTVGEFWNLQLVGPESRSRATNALPGILQKEAAEVSQFFKEIKKIMGQDMKSLPISSLVGKTIEQLFKDKSSLVKKFFKEIRYQSTHFTKFEFNALYLYNNSEIMYLPLIEKLSSVQGILCWDSAIRYLPNSLYRLKHLKVLELGGEKCPPKIDSLEAIAKCENLKVLVLHNMELPIPVEIFSISSLLQLVLAKMRLSSVPVQIQNLQKLKTLELQNNELEILPTKVFQMDSLEYVNLQGNPLNPGKLSKGAIEAIVNYVKKGKKIELDEEQQASFKQIPEFAPFLNNDA